MNPRASAFVFVPSVAGAIPGRRIIGDIIRSFLCRVDTMTALSVHLLAMPSVKQRY